MPEKAILGFTGNLSPEPKVSILLVDDNKANLLSLQAILDQPGLNLVEATSGADALKLVLSDDFAVVLLDVIMPGMDGFDTARRLRESKRSRHTPIIFLTASDIDGTQLEEGYALGAVDFLVKPFRTIALRAKVRGFVELFLDKQLARREAEQLRLLVQGTEDYAIFMLDPDGCIASWNTGAERLKGYRAEEIIGQHFSRFYPPIDIKRGWPEHELEMARKEGRFEDEGWRIRKDGSQFWANVIITALRDERGNLSGFSKVTRDLTERKKAEDNSRRLVEETTARRVAEENARLIQEQREKLHVTLSSIGDAVISTDANGRVNFLNPIAQQLVGCELHEAANRPLTEVFHVVNEGTRLPVENPALQALRDGRIVGLANHTVLIAKDGSEHPIDDSAAPIRDAEGRVIGSILVFRDISERKRAQEELRQSEARFRQLADAMPQIVWAAQPDGNTDYINRRWHEFTGLPGEMVNKGWERIIHPDDAQVARERWAASLRSGAPFEMEIRLLDRRNQEYRWHLNRTVAVLSETGEVARWFGTSTDIHVQKRAAESSRFLAEASAALASVVDYQSTLQKVVKLAVPYFADWSAVDVVEDGELKRLAVAHQDAAKIELIHKIVQEYPPDPQSPGGALAVLRSGEPKLVSEISDDLLERGAKDERHSRLIRSLGLKSYICVPLVVSGSSLGVLTFATAESGRRYTDADLSLALDLTHRAAIAIENTRLYQALKETDRRKDEFLATLAHELRNPLAPIRNSLQILKMTRVDAAVLQQTREMIERQVHHLVRLVDDLLDVSRVMRGKIELRREMVELASVVARAVETAKPLIEAQNHVFNISFPDESLLLDADPVRLAQVVGNLLTNSAKYTESNGRIELSVRREDNRAIMTIRDNGIGIAPDMLPHVFELFVQADHASTKAQGGLGIGLTLVKSLVELHGGTVQASSAGLGQGAEFSVRLPLIERTQNEQPHSTEVETRKVITPSGHRLLVVDDNQDAAVSLSMLLQLQGHEVRAANDGVTALKIAEEFRPDIIFLDIGMPAMDGYEVARRVRKMPGLEKAVLAALTGWGQPEDRRRTSEAGFDHHLVKPPEPMTIEKIIASLPKRNSRS